ncbi:MAG TPA: phosphoribosylanthranilate isomerase [Fimbriimonadaceae bacterium]|nr:phosphoribosylanthranilate isomerase [Fimbriimonadaceae bacterium]
MVTRIKICGLTRRADAELAAELGADALGFIFEPSSPRCIQDVDELERWLPELGPYITKVAVFGRYEGRRIPQHVDAVQAVEFARGPDHRRRIQVLRLGGEKWPVDEEGLSEADAVLLDAYDPKFYGGTGRQVDWHQAAELVGRIRRKTILAGGLDPDNVQTAIEIVQPYAIDVSSGIESAPGLKDPAKLRAMIEAVRSGG